MIVIERRNKRSLHMKFDEKGNSELIKMFKSILYGKKYNLNVLLDMDVLKINRKHDYQMCKLHVIIDNNEEAIIYKDNDNVICKMCEEEAESALWLFEECEKNKAFIPSEFMYINTPKNKKTDFMYCELISK